MTFQISTTLTLSLVSLLYSKSVADEVKGFDLSGRYYSVKSDTQYQQGGYLLKKYEDVIESALTEVDDEFDNVQSQIESSKFNDVTEFSLISGISFTLLILGLMIKSILKRLSKTEMAQLRISDLGSRNKVESLMKILKVKEPTQEDRFLEL